jgi:hypothetical protein
MKRPLALSRLTQVTVRGLLERLELVVLFGVRLRAGIKYEV